MNPATGSPMGLLGVLAKDECYSPVRQASVGTPPGTTVNTATGLFIQDPEWQGGSAGRYRGPGAELKTNPRHQCQPAEACHPTCQNCRIQELV